MRKHALALTALLMSTAAAAQTENPDARADKVVSAMTPAELTVITHGVMAIPFGADTPELPEDAIPGAGYIPGVARLSVPSLRETDASLGVAWAGGARRDKATALPSGMAMGSTWNPELIQRGGAMIAGEAHAKGFNVLLAGGINLVREPRNGRTFEYISEDPVLSGILGAAAVNGIQSQHVISTVKHFALNSQETGRHFMSVNISDAAARESDLLAFQIAIEGSHPGSIMCAYNKVNGEQACGNDYLLNKVLKQDWGYRGWVMSDWGAVHSLKDALNGLDQQSGEQLDAEVYFGDMIGTAAETDPAYAARLKDMNKRILRSMFAVGIDKYPAVTAPIDFAANAAVTRATAEQGIVLLRNRGDALPLAKTAGKIVVIGGAANSGVLSGGGSSQVLGDGAALTIPGGGPFMSENYQKSVPLDAIRARAPEAKVVFRNGRYVTDAVDAARDADVVIVFATQWMSEGFDVPDLSLPAGQDELIAAVAKANPNTIVVLETGGPVTMPWLEDTAAVVEAWYPGGEGAEAIGAVLFGEVNPSGHLPVTFPASVEQLPRPRLDGSLTVEANFIGRGAPGQTLDSDHNIDGSDVGYRWFAREAEAPLFPFGFGLSYTEFTHESLSLSRDGKQATMTIRNTGKRAGADVAQIYLIDKPGGTALRLAGFARVELEPGESKTVTVPIEPRILAEWENGRWHRTAGTYSFQLGHSAEQLGPVATHKYADRRWTDAQGAW